MNEKEPADPVAAHFEHFGYELRPMSGGWVFCEHPRRLNICYRKTPFGCRLFAALTLARSLGDLRETILEAINTINEKSDVTRFSLGRDSDGDFALRARAFYPGEYDRRQFGLFVDAWHDDLHLTRELPRIPEDAGQPDLFEEDGEENAVLVN